MIKFFHHEGRPTPTINNLMVLIRCPTNWTRSIVFVCRPPVLPTLQKYIFREMGKTFLLTAIGLTAVLSTCGGAASILPLESLSARQTLFLLALTVPISTAFTLPIAALFSATITYGRLAADNEFTAVRSGGINIHVLFLPCLLISLVSGIVTFALFNFAIPGILSGL